MKRQVPLTALVFAVSTCLILTLLALGAFCTEPGVDDTVLRENLLPAQQGDPQAQMFMGYLYETGQGVPQNYTKAVQWYQRAAEQGNTLAQSQLGNMYRLGKGVSQNYIYAYMWFALAAKGGNANAKELRRFVASKMNPAEIAEAKRMVHEWTPRK
jgi:TPR repeat protein